MASRGKYVAFADADLSAPIEQLDALLQDLADAEIAILSRALPGARLLRRQSRARETLGKLYAAVAQLTLLGGVPDAHRGLKVFRGDFGRALFRHVREDGVLFDIEALVVATQRGGRISQRAATWSHHPHSRLRFDVWRTFEVALGILRLKLRHRVLLPLRAAGPVRATPRR